MKKSVFVCLVLLVLSVSGCDMFRRMAGRPTSEELELKRMEIARRQKEIELMKIDQKKQADSLAVLDSLRRMCGAVLNVSELGGVYTTALDSRYYVVVGAFRKQGNADALISRVSDAGYLPVSISFRNGLNAVAVAPSDRVSDALLSLKAVKREDFCPEDVWILVNR